MKVKKLILTTLVLLSLGCVRKDTANNNNNMMLMDSSYANDKNVTVVHANDTLRITESMKNFEDNPNITQADIDAGSKTENKEIQYVKQGDTLRIKETELKKK